MELLFFVSSITFFAFALCTLILRRVFSSRISAEKRLSVFEQKLPRDEIKQRVRASRRKTPIRISQLLRDQLASTGVPVKAEEFLVIWITLAVAPSVLVALLGARFLICMLLAAAGLALPPLYVRRSRDKRIKAFEGQLGDAIISMSNCLKSGLTFQQGMANIADQMPQPISYEFARTIREVQLGNTMEAALGNLTRRMPSQDLKLLVTAILISQQVGGSLSEVMDNIAQTILDRIKVKNDVHMLTSQGRMTGMVIGGLPIVIGLILSVINPSYMNVFITTQPGRIMLIVAACMEFVGFIVIRKMISIKY